jgi:predicted lipoprotein DUF2279
MRVRVGKAGIAAVLFVAFLGRGVCPGADTGTFQLFPPNGTRNPLLSPDPDEPGFRLSDSSVLSTEPNAVLGPGLKLHVAELIPSPEPSGILLTTDPTLIRLRPYLTVFVTGTALGYSAANALKEGSTGRFRFTSEGFFGVHTYTGGVDKAAHFVDYTAITRTLETAYRRIGYPVGQSRWMSFGVGVATGLVTELGDATNQFGFSYEDLLMDVLGAASAMGLAESGWSDTLGFRLGSVSQDSTPACCREDSNIGRDYSGEIYTADVKIAGLARRLRVNPGPARFLLLSMTYGTNGYNHGSPEIRQRLVGIEVGLHFSEILRSLGVPSEPLWGEVLYLFFDTFRIPYTAIGVRYDLNNHEWFGPTTGRTPFRVPAGSR